MFQKVTWDTQASAHLPQAKSAKKVDANDEARDFEENERVDDISTQRRSSRKKKNAPVKKFSAPTKSPSHPQRNMPPYKDELVVVSQPPKH